MQAAAPLATSEYATLVGSATNRPSAHGNQTETAADRPGSTAMNRLTHCMANPHCGHPSATERQLADAAARTVTALSSWSRTMDEQCDSFFSRRRLANYLLIWLAMLAFDVLVSWPGRVEWLWLWLLSIVVMYRALQVSAQLFLMVSTVHLVLNASIWAMLCRPAASISQSALTGEYEGGWSMAWSLWPIHDAGLGRFLWPWSDRCSNIANYTVYFYGASLAGSIDRKALLLFMLIAAVDIWFRGSRTAEMIVHGSWRLMPTHAIGHGIYMLLASCIRVMVGLRYRHLIRSDIPISSTTDSFFDSSVPTTVPMGDGVAMIRVLNGQSPPTCVGPPVTSEHDPLFQQPRVLLRSAAPGRPATIASNGSSSGASGSDSGASALNGNNNRGSTGNGFVRSRKRTGPSRANGTSMTCAHATVKQDSPCCECSKAAPLANGRSINAEADTLDVPANTTWHAQHQASIISAHAARLEVLDSFDLCVVGLSAYTATFTWLFPPSLVDVLRASLGHELDSNEATKVPSDSREQAEQQQQSLNTNSTRETDIPTSVLTITARDLTIRVDDVTWRETDLNSDQATITVYGLRPATEYRVSMSLAGYRSRATRICTDARSQDVLPPQPVPVHVPAGTAAQYVSTSALVSNAPTTDSLPGNAVSNTEIATPSCTADTPAPKPVNQKRIVIDQLKSELRQAGEEKRAVQARHRKFRRDTQRAENQLSSEIEALRRAMTRSAGQDVKNRQRVQFLQDLLRRTQIRITELTDEVARAREEHAAASKTSDALETSLSAIREEHREAEQRHQRQQALASRQSRELLSRLQTTETSRDELQSRLAQLRDHELLTLERDYNETTMRLTEAVSRTEDLRLRQSTMQYNKEELDDAAQTRREIAVARERNQSLLQLAREEAAFRDRLRHELANLHAHSSCSSASSSASTPCTSPRIDTPTSPASMKMRHNTE